MWIRPHKCAQCYINLTWCKVHDQTSLEYISQVISFLETNCGQIAVILRQKFHVGMYTNNLNAF